MKKRRVLITGANGMLASDLIPLFGDINLFAFGKDKLDISDRKQVEQALFQTRPNVVINCAAYTKVDKCEIDPSCYSINGLGVFHLAHACRKVGAKLVHISTDYVFDGNTSKFYKENDGRNPINHYGKSKLLGELAAEAELANTSNKFLMCRVQWLFGHNGNNFVNTMLKLAETNSEIKVVDDQFGRPTNTFFLAQSIKHLIDEGAIGVVHLGPSNFCSWFEFAKAILKGKKVLVSPCKSDDFPRPAKRPRYSVLDVTKSTAYGVDSRCWEEHLRCFLK